MEIFKRSHSVATWKNVIVLIFQLNAHFWKRIFWKIESFIFSLFLFLMLDVFCLLILKMDVINQYCIGKLKSWWLCWRFTIANLIYYFCFSIILTEYQLFIIDATFLHARFSGRKKSGLSANVKEISLEIHKEYKALNLH